MTETRIKSLKEQIKIICLVMGIIYSGFAGFGLFIVLIQKLMMLGTGMELQEWKEMQTIHTIFIIYLPLVIILGITYIRFGVSIKKPSKKPILTNKILWWISASISISYSIVSFTVLLKDMASYFSIFIIMTIISGLIGLIVIMLAFNLPQYFLSKKIKELVNLEIQSQR